VKVSIGMPVYNGERFISEALDSLLNQTYEEFELIISDNASTDGTEAICRDYARRDRRIRYVREDVNRGAAWNHNRLVHLATGELFKWAPADDLHEREHVAKCVAALEADSEAVAAYTKSIFIDEAGNRLQSYNPGWDLRSDRAFDRMRIVILRGGHWVNADPLLGVMRIDALRKTRLTPRYQGGDKRPIGELSLIGKIVEVPDHLLLRRRHAAASNTNNPHTSKYDAAGVAWMTEFFKGSSLQIRLPSWTLLADHSLSVWRSHLSPSDKLKLGGVVIRACGWQRHFLLTELKALGSPILR
jgi:glycosyltransferase involved in cell wall biosynthesis